MEWQHHIGLPQMEYLLNKAWGTLRTSCRMRCCQFTPDLHYTAAILAISEGKSQKGEHGGLFIATHAIILRCYNQIYKHDIKIMNTWQSTCTWIIPRLGNAYAHFISKLSVHIGVNMHSMSRECIYTQESYTGIYSKVSKGEVGGIDWHATPCGILTLVLIALWWGDQCVYQELWSGRREVWDGVSCGPWADLNPNHTQHHSQMQCLHLMCQTGETYISILWCLSLISLPPQGRM